MAVLVWKALSSAVWHLLKRCSKSIKSRVKNYDSRCAQLNWPFSVQVEGDVIERFICLQPANRGGPSIVACKGFSDRLFQRNDDHAIHNTRMPRRVQAEVRNQFVQTSR